MATIASLVVDIGADTSKLRSSAERGVKSLDKFASGFEGMSRRASIVGSTIGNIASNIARNVTRHIIQSVDEFIDRGQQLAAVGQSFESLTAAIGGAEPVMDAVRSSTQGLVGDLDIMLNTNKALLLGLPVTAQDMGNLAQTAVVLGRAMGLGPNQAFGDLITALGRSSPLILDNLGLTVKVGEANEAYATKLRKTVGELTDVEKKTAFYEAAMEKARAKVAEIGAVQLTLSDRYQQTTTWVQNLLDKTSRQIQQSPVLGAAIESIGVQLRRAFGTDQQALVEQVGALVDKFALGLVKAAPIAVEAGRFIANTWTGIKLIFTGTLWAVARLMEGFLELVSSAANAATMIPGIGQHFEGMAQAIAGAESFLESFRMEMGNSTASVLDGAASQNAALDTLQVSITNVRTAMEAANTTTSDWRGGVEGLNDVVTIAAGTIEGAVAVTKRWQLGILGVADAIKVVGGLGAPSGPGGGGGGSPEAVVLGGGGGSGSESGGGSGGGALAIFGGGGGGGGGFTGIQGGSRNTDMFGRPTVSWFTGAIINVNAPRGGASGAAWGREAADAIMAELKGRGARFASS